MEKDTLVYYHRRKDTNEVFYVGIGNSERPYSKTGRNRFWGRIVNKVGYDIEIVHTKLTWEEACKLERQYIKEFGRRDLGLGNLVNLTDGGEGGENPSKETRKKISEGNKGKILTKKTKQLIGSSKQGEKSNHSILTEKDVRKIVKEYTTTNITQEELGKKYGVSGQYISKIIQGKVWGHLNLQTDRNNKSKKLTKEDVLEIRRLGALGGITHREIAEKFGIKRRSATSIINRNNWKHI